MKKLLLVALLALIGTSAFAQKEVIGVGLNFHYTPCLEDGADLNHIGVSGKFQYGITDAIRGEMQIGYDFKEKDISVFEAGVNLHYLFNITDKFRVYPIVGVGYANINYDFIVEQSDDEVYVNGGLGAEYDIANNFALSVEGKYQYIKDFTRLPISVGLIYKF